MYRKINDFLADWKRESESTHKVFSHLTDDSLKYLSHTNGRTIGFLSWHIVLSMGELMGKTNLSVDYPPEDSDEPSSANSIAQTYKSVSDSLTKEIESKWKDDILEEEVEAFGRKWTISSMLKAMIFHQIHHRGQLTIMMRQANLLVPGTLGPAREEWEKMGMKAPK